VIDQRAERSESAEVEWEEREVLEGTRARGGSR
jgi:hypothetical protein